MEGATLILSFRHLPNTGAPSGRALEASNPGLYVAMLISATTGSSIC